MHVEKIPVCICVDSDGCYAVGKDESQAREAYENDVGALNECGGFRLVCMTVAVPLPETVELEGTAPPDGAAKLEVVK